MSSKRENLVRLVAITLVAAASLFVLGSIAMASGLINAVNPGSADSANTPAIVPPLLAPPPGVASYVAVTDLAQKVTASDGRPVAQLANPLAESVDSVRVYLPQNVAPDESVAAEHSIYYEVLASVEYRANGQLFIVATARPSSIAAQLATAFGDQEVTLDNGTRAWTTTNLSGSMPNRVVLLSNNLIVSIAGDASLARLEDLAARVVVH